MIYLVLERKEWKRNGPAKRVQVPGGRRRCDSRRQFYTCYRLLSFQFCLERILNTHMLGVPHIVLIHVRLQILITNNRSCLHI